MSNELEIETPQAELIATMEINKLIGSNINSWKAERERRALSKKASVNSPSMDDLVEEQNARSSLTKSR